MQILRLYPRYWRERYGAELAALLEAREPGVRDTLDLIRGAVDAHLHPPAPSIVPPLASLTGGALATVLAVGLALDPVPADWPGFTADLLPLAVTAQGCLLVALTGLVLRLGDLPARSTAIVVLAIACQATFGLALVAAAAGLWYGAITGAAMTVAALGTSGVASLLVRRGDAAEGTVMLVAPLVLLIPTTAAWIVFGLAWTAVGALQLVGRTRPRGRLEPA